MVLNNPGFRPEMLGLDLPRHVYVHIAGVDVVRVSANDFYVLEDNARVPSGVSYMLENRETMMKLFPSFSPSTLWRPSTIIRRCCCERCAR